MRNITKPFQCSECGGRINSRYGLCGSCYEVEKKKACSSQFFPGNYMAPDDPQYVDIEVVKFSPTL